MERDYEVYLGNHAAGKVQLLKQGLYYRVLCRCVVPHDTVHRLYGVGEQGYENLGVVVPEGDGFLLDRRIPAKRLEGCTRFLLSDGSEPESEQKPEPDSEAETFFPIHPEEPFSYLHQLESAFLEERDGQIGVRIQEHPGAV